MFLFLANLLIIRVILELLIIIKIVENYQNLHLQILSFSQI